MDRAFSFLRDTLRSVGGYDTQSLVKLCNFSMMPVLWVLNLFYFFDLIYVIVQNNSINIY